MDGMNKGFKTASDKFEKVINSSEKILRSADRILEILLEGHHNIIVIVGAGTVVILVVLVLVQIIYMIKLAEYFKKKNVESDEKIKELKESWSQLEAEINSLVQEINQAKARTQETAIVSHRVHRVPAEESMGSFHGGVERLQPVSERFFPPGTQKFMP